MAIHRRYCVAYEDSGSEMLYITDASRIFPELATFDIDDIFPDHTMLSFVSRHPSVTTMHSRCSSNGAPHFTIAKT